MGKGREVYPRMLHNYARLQMIKAKIIPHLTAKVRSIYLFSDPGVYKDSAIRELFSGWGMKKRQEAVNGRLCDNAQNTAVNHN